LIIGRQLDIFLSKHQNFHAYFNKSPKSKLIYLSGSSGLYGFSAEQAKKTISDTSIAIFNYGLIGTVGIKTMQKIIENECNNGDIVVFGGEIALSPDPNAELNLWQAYHFASLSILSEQSISSYLKAARAKIHQFFNHFNRVVTNESLKITGDAKIEILDNGDLAQGEYLPKLTEVRELYYGQVRDSSTIYKNVNIIISLAEHCHENNISFVVVHAPMSDYLYKRDKPYVNLFYSLIEQAGIAIITNQEKSLFPVNQMYDYHYHPGIKARAKHTQNVVGGIKSHLNKAN
jgi:hypothetical protein